MEQQQQQQQFYYPTHQTHQAQPSQAQHQLNGVNYAYPPQHQPGQQIQPPLAPHSNYQNVPPAQPQYGMPPMSGKTGNTAVSSALPHQQAVSSFPQTGVPPASLPPTARMPSVQPPNASHMRMPSNTNMNVQDGQQQSSVGSDQMHQVNNAMQEMNMNSPPQFDMAKPPQQHALQSPSQMYANGPQQPLGVHSPAPQQPQFAPQQAQSSPAPPQSQFAPQQAQPSPAQQQPQFVPQQTQSRPPTTGWQPAQQPLPPHAPLPPQNATLPPNMTQSPIPPSQQPLSPPGSMPPQMQPQMQQQYSQPPRPSYPPQNYQSPTARMPPMPTGQQQPMSAPPQAGMQGGMQARYPPAPQTQQPNYGYQQPQQQQQQQRLDPDSMPSVVQVIEDDKIKGQNSDNMFTTSVPANVPPLVTTITQTENFIINDGGCARPNHLRSTVYQVPASEDTLKSTTIPLAIVCQPFDEAEVEGRMQVPVSNSEILRCNRCKAYMNPYMRFIDGGRRFQCSLCHHISEVTSSYFANLDHTGQRLDKFHRPELYLGSFEFRATAEYCRNSVPNARRPHIIFACELTVTSKPILLQLATHLPDIIRNYLPTDPLNPGSPPPLVGFLTYNSKIQLYDLVNNGHSHIVCDVASTFPPFTTFLADPLLHAEQIDNFFKMLPTLYQDSELETQTVLGPVIEAALQTCQADIGNWLATPPSETPANGQQNQSQPAGTSIPVGKVYLFQSTLPTFGADGETPGRLKPRWTTSPDEVRKLLGTDKEKSILQPDTNKYYINLGQRCVTDFASGVELFLFPPANGPYLDVATLGELVRLTGTGAIYKYFNDYSDRFLTDLKYSLQSSFAFDAIMKVRTSTGIRAHEHVGNFFSRTTSDIECATINTGCNYAVELKYDDKLPEDELVVFQVAILYTSISGERRVRVHNMALSPCQQIADVYRQSDCDTTINVLIRQAITALRAGEKTVQQTKELLISRVISILTAYRRHCAQPGSSLGQLILPEGLKLLPMYLCGVLKCDAIDGGSEMTPDDKAYAQMKLLGSSLSLSQVTLYPRMIRIEYDGENSSSLNAVQIRCSSHRLNNSPNALAFLIENGFYLMLFFPNLNVPNHRQFLSAVFGPNVDSIQKINPEMGLPKLLTAESQFINQIVENIERERRKAMRLYVIRQGLDKLESIFRSFLYEDKKPTSNVVGGDSFKYDGPSYVDLLCHLHKEIRANLN